MSFLSVLKCSKTVGSYSIFSGFLFSAALFFCIGCNSEEKSEVSELRNVLLTEPLSASANNSTDYSGVIEEGASVNASFMADGKIASINVKEGDRVSKGALIASLDDSDYRIGVSQLEAQYNQMTKEKERMDAMFEKHNIAPNDYEKFCAGYEQLGLQLEMAKRKLDYTRLYAPASGYIAAKNLNVGELVGAGTPVVNIVDDSRLVASVDMPVSVYLDRDNIVSVAGKVPGIKDTLPLEILSFTPDVDNNMLYHLKLRIPANFAAELSPGMNIAVNVVSSNSPNGGTLIPSRAIFDSEGNRYVWVYNSEDSTIHKKEVVIKGVPEGKLSRVDGLSGDERIVEVGVKQLYEGEKVNVLNRKDIGL